MSNGGTYDDVYDLFWANGCDVVCLENEMYDILSDMVDIYRSVEGAGYFVTITSACREVDNSLHDDGLAIDVRTIDLTGGGNGANANEIADELAHELGDDYDVILHYGTGCTTVRLFLCCYSISV